MAKALITLRDSKSHTRGSKVYKLNTPVPSTDPEEIEYCKACGCFDVKMITEPKAAPPAAPKVENEAKAGPTPAAEPVTEAKPDRAKSGNKTARKTGSARKRRVKVGEE